MLYFCQLIEWCGLSLVFKQALLKKRQSQILCGIPISVCGIPAGMGISQSEMGIPQRTWSWLSFNDFWFKCKCWPCYSILLHIYNIAVMISNHDLAHILTYGRDQEWYQFWQLLRVLFDSSCHGNSAKWNGNSAKNLGFGPNKYSTHSDTNGCQNLNI